MTRYQFIINRWLTIAILVFKYQFTYSSAIIIKYTTLCHRCRSFWHLLYSQSKESHGTISDLNECSYRTIHVPCNILRYFLTRQFRSMAVSFCDRCGLCPLRFVAGFVCGCFILRPFRFAAISVWVLIRVWPLWPVTSSEVDGHFMVTTISMYLISPMFSHLYLC